MIISKNFVIGHIPKTGGHALAVMLNKIKGLDYSSPFKLRDSGRQAIGTEHYKHRSLNDLSSDELAGKDILCVIRFMPNWLLSYMVGQALHHKLDGNNVLKKIDVGKTYYRDEKRVVQKLLPPHLMCHSTFPDYTLKKMGVTEHNVKWFKQETLAEDILKYFKITDQEVQAKIRTVRRTNHSYDGYKPRNYWNDEAVKILYQNNPLWSFIEKPLYENSGIELYQYVEVSKTYRKLRDAASKKA